jgi:HD-GYP domain-containing protein (c-di-GMP phosphodiesterase class II)
MPSEPFPPTQDTAAEPSSGLAQVLRRWNVLIAQNGALSPRELVDGIADIFYADLVVWWQQAPEGGLVVKVAGGPSSGQHLAKTLGRGRPLAGEAVLHGKPVLLNRVELAADSARKEIMGRLPRARSGIAFPVFAEGQAIGAIEIWNRRDSLLFTVDSLKTTEELLGWLPPYLSGIFAQERLVEAQNMNQRFIALSLAFAEMPDLKSLLGRICEEAQSLLACEQVALLIHNEETQDLYDPTGRVQKRVPSGEGLIGTAFWNRTPIVAAPVASYPGYIPGTDALFQTYTREMLVAPLTISGKTLGVLVAYNRITNRFSDADLEDIAPFTSLAAVAIEDQLQRISVRNTFINSIESLVQALEAKDPETRGHSLRVRYYATAIGKNLLRDPELIQALELSALLHDIGKIGMRDDVLFKPGSVTDEEYAHIKQHPLAGARILEPLIREPAVLDGVKYHHERWDGSGYPSGLKGDEIPLFGRIIAVADTFDALTSDRPYRKGDDPFAVLAYLRKHSGSHFDPRVVDAFANALNSGAISVPPPITPPLEIQ